MQVMVNGEPRDVRAGLTLSELLEAEGEPASHVLVELNGQYLSARECRERILAGGDRVEIIHPAFGG